MKKWISLMLVALMLLAPLGAFAEGEDPAESGAPGTTAPAETTPPEPTAPAAADTPAPTDTPTPTPSPEETPAASQSPDPSDSPEPSASLEPSASPTASPRPGGASETELVIDTAHVYANMEKSYANGYMPKVEGGKAHFVLPLLGDVMGDVIRVTPEISTSGPFLYGNYQFDLKKTTEQAQDEAGNTVSEEVFLISLPLTLAKNRYNGTYPITFHVSYTDLNGEPANQDFVLQVTITDGKNQSSGGGYSGPSAVKKPVLVVEESEFSAASIQGGEGFTLTLTVKNVGDLEAKNVRILASSSSQGIYRSDGLAPVFLLQLDKEELQQVSFTFASDKTVFAGRHGLNVELSYEDKYGNAFSDGVPLQIGVMQEASIGFDEMKLPESVTSGETFTQPVCVYNTGYAPVYNVRCTLSMEGLIAASAFLGTLEPQQSADKAISIFVTTLPGKEKYGYTYGDLRITYEDMAGQEHTEFQSLQTNLVAPVVITDEEKAKQEQEQKEQQTLSQWWVSLLVAIAFILIILSAIVIARFTRMLKMK